MRKSSSFVRPPLGRSSADQPSSPGARVPSVPSAPHRMLSPKDTLVDRPVKAAKLHPGIDALLNPRHPGATPYRVVLGDVRPACCALILPRCPSTCPTARPGGSSPGVNCGLVHPRAVPCSAAGRCARCMLRAAAAPGCCSLQLRPGSSYALAHRCTCGALGHHTQWRQSQPATHRRPGPGAIRKCPCPGHFALPKRQSPRQACKAGGLKPHAAARRCARSCSTRGGAWRTSWRGTPHGGTRSGTPARRSWSSPCWPATGACGSAAQVLPWLVPDGAGHSGAPCILHGCAADQSLHLEGAWAVVVRLLAVQASQAHASMPSRRVEGEGQAQVRSLSAACQLQTGPP